MLDNFVYSEDLNKYLVSVIFFFCFDFFLFLFSICGEFFVERKENGLFSYFSFFNIF